MATFTFSRRVVDLPEGIDRKKTFEAKSQIEALQMASDYWFSGEKINDYMINNNGVITLLSANPSGNVIGTLI